MSDVAFQTRARTIDHLGRGQIADCPTAVSELWKNAYDAYATKVGLHIFDGKHPIAAVTDDGHGMDYDEFVNRWLIVGTEIKVAGSTTPKEDRNGLPTRERQGEKGIGRLSVAFLGPIVFVISKRKNKPFVGALVDWRLFENPFLLLGDIQIPVEQFSTREDLSLLLPDMFTRLGENIGGNDADADKQQRIRAAWDRQGSIQRHHKEVETSKLIQATTAARSELTSVLIERCLDQWHVWGGQDDQGTALFVLEINHELSVWSNPEIPVGDPEAEAIKDSLRETLIGFVDPYLEAPVEFSYAVTIHKADRQETIISSSTLFTWGDLRALEHVVEGAVDEHGVFKGRVKAFGQDLGEVTILPTDRPTPLAARTVVGPFTLCIGTFEQERVKTSLSSEQYQHAVAMAEKYAGLAVYRDKLRVMPYGRAQADYFGIEDRRSRHAGREFWSFRRTFGRVAITRQDNPNLKDKAGREGLIDNQAKREFRILVVEILKTSARRFFGTGSKHRKEYLPEIITANEVAKQAEDNSQARRASEFRKSLRASTPKLQFAGEAAKAARDEIRQVIETSDLSQLIHFGYRILELEAEKSALMLPPRPGKLGSAEDDYRAYRDGYSAFCEETEAIRQEWAEAVQRVKKKPAVEESRATASAHSEQLFTALMNWQRNIVSLLEGENDRSKESIRRDASRYESQSAPLIEDLVAGRTQFADLMRQLEAIREALHLEFSQRYGGYIRVLENLAQGIDVDALTAWSVEQRQEMEGRVDQLHALAQLGVTVELVGHELEAHDADIRRHLEELPEGLKTQKTWRDLRDSIRALFDRMRFMTPLQLSGRRFLKEISGEGIAEYVEEFFEGRFQKGRIRFTATDKFRALKIKEYPSRIYPVFVNLTNNALYWVSFGENREILFDLVGDDVVVADSGRGVDPDDVDSLFRLYFTRRTEGRGVGLYLCRANLAAGAHSIAYAREMKHKLLPGANFVIRLRGLEHG